MKIIHIVHGKANPNSANGISRVVYNLNKYEKLAGIDSQIWAIVDGCKSHTTYVRDEYVTVECFPRVRPWGGKEIIRNILEAGDVDLVHFHLIWFYDKNIIAEALVKESIPYIVTTHGTYSNPHAYTGKRLVAKWLFELKYLQMAKECHILTPEEGTGLRKYGYTGKSFVAYNGIGRDELPMTMGTNYYADEPYVMKVKIATVSVLRQDKNIDLIIRAIALLPEEIRRQMVFICIGPDWKGNAKKYRALSKELGVKENFRYLGAKYGQEKYDALNSADGYLMASDSEGFSMSIIDAMGCGLPMILTSGCNMKYVDEQNYYIMCEPYEYELARAILQLTEMGADKRREMGERARKVLEKNLYWDEIVKGMIANYERIIETK